MIFYYIENDERTKPFCHERQWGIFPNSVAAAGWLAIAGRMDGAGSFAISDYLK